MIWLHVLFLCCILARAADYLIIVAGNPALNVMNESYNRAILK